jgi:methionyl-tRNA formyltransferase
MTRTPDGRLLKLTNARALSENSDTEPGTVVDLKATGEGEIIISCGEGMLSVTGVIPEGKKRMSSADFIRGRKVAVGDILKY